jgi:proline iminopeptidase
MSDVDAVRAHLGIEQIHVFGHSWGGLLGQLYLAQHPDRVSSLFLCSSAPGVGQEWRTCGKEIFEFNRRRAGWLGFAAMGVDSVGMLVPPIADASARRLIARVWRNYFPDPRIAPSATAASLAGIHAAPMRETGRAVGAADAGLLEGIGRTAIPVVIEFGGDDIYVTAADVLRRRFPNARHESLPHSGHLPWLQDPERFRAMLAEFYARSTR